MENKHQGNGVLDEAKAENHDKACDESTSELVQRVIENPEVLSGVLETPKAQAMVYQFIGPVPPPSLLREYEDLMPGLGNRLVELTEREQAHRHKQDKEHLEGNMSLSSRGQWMAFVIVMTILIAAFVFGLRGETVLAGALVTINMTAICSVFIWGKYFTSKSTPKENHDAPDSNNKI